MSRRNEKGPKRRLPHAAGLATLITAVALFLLLSRSEIRKALLPHPAILLAALAGVWLLAFWIAWERASGKG